MDASLKAARSFSIMRKVFNSENHDQSKINNLNATNATEAEQCRLQAADAREKKEADATSRAEQRIASEVVEREAASSSQDRRERL
jgi:hypothetical protein